jgi:cyclophilin family peptidyl-prolyl cis-trans isomerase
MVVYYTEYIAYQIYSNNTNGSQFFVLYKSATHLNFKHTVFGMVVGGLTTRSAMEKVPVDDDDRPLVGVTQSFQIQ